MSWCGVCESELVCNVAHFEAMVSVLLKATEIQKSVLMSCKPWSKGGPTRRGVKGGSGAVAYTCLLFGFIFVYMPSANALARSHCLYNELQPMQLLCPTILNLRGIQQYHASHITRQPRVTVISPHACSPRLLRP